MFTLKFVEQSIIRAALAKSGVEYDDDSLGTRCDFDVDKLLLLSAVVKLSNFFLSHAYDIPPETFTLPTLPTEVPVLTVEVGIAVFLFKVSDDR